MFFISLFFSASNESASHTFPHLMTSDAPSFRDASRRAEVASRKAHSSPTGAPRARFSSRGSLPGERSLSRRAPALTRRRTCSDPVARLGDREPQNEEQAAPPLDVSLRETPPPGSAETTMREFVFWPLWCVRFVAHDPTSRAFQLITGPWYCVSLDVCLGRECVERAECLRFPRGTRTKTSALVAPSRPWRLRSIGVLPRPKAARDLQPLRNRVTANAPRACRPGSAMTRL